MRAFKEQIKVLDRAIEHQFEIIPNPPISIPDIGKVYSASIISEIRNTHRFDSQASASKFASRGWKRIQSNGFEAEYSRMMKTGNRNLLYHQLEAANFVRRYGPKFRRNYGLKFYRENRFQSKRALSSIARKMIRLVFRC